MDSEKPQEPIDYETLWCEPPDYENDYLLEQLLEEEEILLPKLDQCCIECGRPIDFCDCK